MSEASIYVTGAWAELRGYSTKPLVESLTVLHPKRHYNRAFQEKRWDGRVRLFEGRSFPAGLIGNVKSWFHDNEGAVPPVVGLADAPVAVDGFDEWYLGGLGPKGDSPLWDTQMRAVHTMLEQSRGILKIPTNGGKTEIMACVAKLLLDHMGWRTLIVTSRKGLSRQTADRLRGYLEPDVQIGQCGDGQKLIGDITVATAQTLIKFKPSTRKVRGTHRVKQIPGDPDLIKMLKTYEVLILDEAHHASSESWYEIAMSSGARRRYGMSGTPLKGSDLADARLIGATGPVIYEVDPQVLVDAGVSSKPKIVMVMADNASEPAMEPEIEVYENAATGKEYQRRRWPTYAEAYDACVVKSTRYNRNGVIRAVEWLADHGRRNLMLSRRTEHFRALEELLAETGWQYAALQGSTDMQVRLDGKRQLGAGTIRTLLATTIFDEGEDVGGIESLVLAEGVKSDTNALQRLGRGMRTAGCRYEDLWVVDFIPTSHPRLIEHGLKRAEAYEAEGYEVLVVEDWPAPGEDSPDDLLPFENWDEVYADVHG